MKLFKFLAVVIVILGIVGYFQGWYEVKKTDDDTYTVKLDREKIKDDTKKAADKTKGVIDKVKDKISGPQTLTGKFKGFDILSRSLKIETDDGELKSFKIDAADLKDGAKALAALQAMATDKAITLKYEEKDGVTKVLEVNAAE